MDGHNSVKSLTFLTVLFLLLMRIGARDVRSIEGQRQKLIRLLANSVATNLTTEIKTDGVANVLTLDQWGSAEVFFQVVNSKASLTAFIDVSCNAVLQWKVSLHELGDMELLWRPVEIDKPDDEYGPKVFLHVKKSHLNGHSIALATYETRDSQVFQLKEAPRGLYKIDMRSMSSFKQVVELSVLGGDKLDLHIPLLPTDNQVSVAQITSDYFNFYWQPVEMNESEKGEQTEYCIAVNSHRNLDQLCEVEDMLRRSPHWVVVFSCFGGPNVYHMRQPLNPNQVHYVNLFAVSRLSNRSRPYRGLTIPKAKTSLFTRLEEETTLNLKINKGSVYHVIYFDLHTPGTIRLSYVACDGPISVYVAKEGNVLRKLGFRSMKTHLLRSASVGRYYVTVTKRFHGELQIRVHVAHGKRWGPFPRLPKGIAVKEWPMLRTCESITIAWITGHGKQQFCLFIGQENAKAFKKLHNVCFKPANDPGMLLVTCLDKKIRRGENTVFWRTIKGLEPCMEYVFYIQVKRRRADDTLLYKPLKVRTRCDSCNYFS